MTIDEIIEKENKLFEDNQKVVDTQIILDDVTISELYADDTEIIEEALEKYQYASDYHKQIAKWLEELKELRSMVKSTAFKDGYNKGGADAIEEFINTIKPRMKWDNDIYTLAIKHCIEVAEQLKEQNNENKN